VGWSFGAKPTDVAGELRSRLTWESASASNRCLDIALRMDAAYAAVETVHKATGTREVWCAVILLRYRRDKNDPYPFGNKDLEESMGPRACECPARILDLLTPTNNEHALAWRAACRESIGRRMPAVGTRVRFERAIKFGDGSSETEFTVIQLPRRRKVLRGANGSHYRLQQRVWQQVPWQVLSGA